MHLLNEHARFGIRAKVFSLVLFAAILPTALVGTSSYWTARDELTKKLSDRLGTRASLAAMSISDWFRTKVQEANVYASSSIVSSKDVTQIQAYLSEVRGRLDYVALAVVDGDGSPIASDGSLDSFTLRDEVLWIVPNGNESRLWVRAPVEPSPSSSWHFVMLCELESLRGELPGDPGEQLFLLSAGEDEQRLVMAQPMDAVPPDGTFSGHDELTERTGPDGKTYLATVSEVDSDLAVPLFVHAETERGAAFAAVDDLRRRIVGISIGVAAIAIVLAMFFAVSLTRPLESLTEGAHAVSNGEYELELPVRTRDEIGYLTQAFNRMAAALKESHQRLERLSTTDELTQLVNRRQLEVTLEDALQRGENTNEPFALVMIDIDHFKKFNDTHGHLEGDALLTRLGTYLRDNLRGADVAARYGGEEFLLVLANTAGDDAKAKANALRETFDEGEVTLSMGVAAWPRDGASSSDLIAAADRALYTAKKKGRNRVVLAGRPKAQRTRAR